MFWDQLSLSVAKAIFWLMIMGGFGFILWFFIREFSKYKVQQVKMRIEFWSIVTDRICLVSMIMFRKVADYLLEEVESKKPKEEE